MKTIKYYKDLNSFVEVNKNTNGRFFLLVAEKTKFDLEKLQNLNIDFKGAIVPQIVYEDFNSNEGLIACELNDDINTYLLEDMQEADIDIMKFSKFDSILIMIDGLSKYITTFLETVFQKLPINSEIVGGGAGKLTLKQEPVIFSNKGIFKDAAVVLAAKTKINVGVENGWEYLEGPFIVTNAQKNVLKSLNFTNAFELYKEVVEKDSGLKFDENNFFDIVKAYPFGIVKFNEEIVVRDPITLDEEGNIVLVGDIEQNSTINILKGEKTKLIDSSSKAIKNALDKVKDKKKIKNIVLFDCISRTMFLEDDFKEELSAIKKEVPSKLVFGAMTLGEIANNGNEYINFYNKTCVVGVLC